MTRWPTSPLRHLDQDETEPRRWELGANGHGPAGPQLAERLCEQIRAWDRDRTPQPLITAYPAATSDEELPTLHLARVGDAVTVSPHPVSASTVCCLANVRARAYAAEGDAAGCDRALSQTEEHFAAIDPVIPRPWGGHVGEATMSGFRGIAHYTLALTDRDTRAADRAVPLLRHAVDHFGPGYARFRGHTLPDLAGAHALAGDRDTAVTIGHQAVDAISALSSPRAYDRLRTLDTVLEPLHTSPGVADLRDRLTTTAA